MSYRLVAFSVRGTHKYVIGSSKVAGLDASASVPPREGTTFATMQNARGYVRREFAGISSYHRFELVNDAGDPVQVGMRTGFNGTGKRIVWQDVPYEVQQGKPSWHQAKAGAVCAAVSRFGSKGEADAFAERYRAAHPGEPAVVVRTRA